MQVLADSPEFNQYIWDKIVEVNAELPRVQTVKPVNDVHTFVHVNVWLLYVNLWTFFFELYGESLTYVFFLCS